MPFALPPAQKIDDTPPEPLVVRRSITKFLAAQLRACGWQARRLLDGEVPTAPREPLSGAGLLGTAVHRALASIYGVWERGDRVNVEDTALNQMWARAWTALAPHTPPHEEGTGILRTYIGVHEPTFVGRQRSHRVLFVERRLRAPLLRDGLALTLESTPDVVVLSLGKRPTLAAWEHTTRALPLASADDLAYMSLIDQYCLGHSSSIPEELRGVRRAVLVDDVTTATVTPITLTAAQGAGMLEDLVASIRATLEAEPPTLAAPGEISCGRCGYRLVCPAAWRTDDDTATNRTRGQSDE